MLEREAWRFINNRRADDAEYLRSLDSVSNQRGKRIAVEELSQGS